MTSEGIPIAGWSYTAKAPNADVQRRQQVRQYANHLQGLELEWDVLIAGTPADSEVRRRAWAVARAVSQSAELRQAFLDSQSLPQPDEDQTAENLLSLAEMDKYRPYVTALTLLACLDLPLLQSFMDL